MTVEIKWDKECLREGNREVSQDKLKRSKWNSNKHEDGTWHKTYIMRLKLQKIYEIIMIHQYELTMF